MIKTTRGKLIDAELSPIHVHGDKCMTVLVELYDDVKSKVYGTCLQSEMEDLEIGQDYNIDVFQSFYDHFVVSINKGEGE